MRLLATLRVALRALRVHKGRSFLTSLGIIIGIAAVIAMVSAGDGVQQKLDEQMESVGKNLIMVRPGARSHSGVVTDTARLTREDAAVVRKLAAPYVKGVAEIQLTHRPADSRYGKWPTVVNGTVPELQVVRGWGAATGRFFTREETESAADVCVLGDTVRKKLFPDEPNPLGQTIHVGDLPLRVVGVLAAKGRTPAGSDQDDELFLPITTFQHKMAGEDSISTILSVARSSPLLEPAREAIERAMRQAHHVKEGAEDFDVSTVDEMAQVAYVLVDAVRALVAVIASLSLVVGGVGIMNIMLVSVTERTREIGLRMAVGATGGHILTQFLIEAIVLSVIGGVIGVAVGLTGAAALAMTRDWPLVISPFIVMLAVGVSAGVGIFFGFYPAWKASRLDPIDALRYE